MPDPSQIRFDMGRLGIGQQLLPSVGWLYTWGGAPATWAEAMALAAAGQGVCDCSGYARVALRHLHLWPSAWGNGRPTTRIFADNCDPVPLGQQRPGDLAYYPGHVMVVLSYPHPELLASAVIGASGGREGTRGNNPNARVKIFPTHLYRRGRDGKQDFITFMRPKQSRLVT